MIKPTDTSVGRESKPARPAADRLVSGQAAALLRVLSFVALALAVSSAAILVALRLIHFFEPDLLPWEFKSAYPLLLIGVAFASLQLILPRTRSQLLMGFIVSTAFILWGVEQFVLNPGLAMFIDDIVVLLFVIDLGLVIYGHLKPAPHSAEEHHDEFAE